MSVSNYKRYVICPECNNEVIAQNLCEHFRKEHKRELSTGEMTEILSKMTREPTRKPNLPRDPKKFLADLKIRQKTELENKMKKFGQQTPFSMRQWGDGRPKRTGPTGPEKR